MMLFETAMTIMSYAFIKSSLNMLKTRTRNDAFWRYLKRYFEIAENDLTTRTPMYVFGRYLKRCFGTADFFW